MGYEGRGEEMGGLGPDWLLAGGSVRPAAAARARYRRSLAAGCALQAGLWMLLALGLELPTPRLEEAAAHVVPLVLWPAPGAVRLSSPVPAPRLVRLSPALPALKALRQPTPLALAAATRLAPLPAMLAAAVPTAKPAVPAPRSAVSVPPRSPAAGSRVELGQFGAPEGARPRPGTPLPIPQLGSFGAAAAAAEPVPSRAVAASGFAGAEVAAAGLSRPTGNLHLAGFAASGAGVGAAVPTGEVQLAGFGSAADAAAPPAPTGRVVSAGFNRIPVSPPAVVTVPAAAADFEPPQVLDWPTPVYTPLAVQQHVEGEVVLQVRFTASGSAQVLAVVQGLGDGLDQAAAACARQLKFLPARRHGQPVDATVVVRIRFRLAN